MAKCKTEFRWPVTYFPMQVCVVDEETGEETNHRLNYNDGRLTVQAQKGLDAEKSKAASVEETAGGETSSPGPEAVRPE